VEEIFKEQKTNVWTNKRTSIGFYAFRKFDFGAEKDTVMISQE
jgi:hypothetical protein